MAVKPAPRRLEIVPLDCAGIDIGKAKHFMAVDPRHSDDFIKANTNDASWGVPFNSVSVDTAYLFSIISYPPGQVIER